MDPRVPQKRTFKPSSNETPHRPRFSQQPYFLPLAYCEDPHLYMEGDEVAAAEGSRGLFQRLIFGVIVQFIKQLVAPDRDVVVVRGGRAVLGHDRRVVVDIRAYRRVEHGTVLAPTGENEVRDAVPAQQIVER